MSTAAWNKTFAAATRLAPAEDWKQDLARAVREATQAEFVSVLTCPPGDWRDLRAATFPGPYAKLIERIDDDFRARIEQAGEGWQTAVKRHGRVYAPIEVAMNRPLAEELRHRVLRPADIDGYLVAFLTDPRGALLGMVAVGAPCGHDELAARALDGLGETVRLAEATLSSALSLAEACGHPTSPRRRTEDASPSLAVLSSREREIASLVAAGHTNVNIGAHLDISESTVATHLRRIFKKLHIGSRVHLCNQWHDSFG